MGLAGWEVGVGGWKEQGVMGKRIETGRHSAQQA